MSLNIEQVYDCLRNFDFANFFRELHWSPPVSEGKKPIEGEYSRREIARFVGVPVFEVSAADGDIPRPLTRDRLYKELSSLFRRSLLIFVDGSRKQSIWYWVKRERDSIYRREFSYVIGQPEDVLLTKLNSIVADIIALDKKSERKGSSALQKRTALKEIYEKFDAQRRQFSHCISGIKGQQECDLYASILLNRLIFLYFLQQRGFIDGGHKTYLEDALRRSHTDCYYREFLLPLFFEGLAKPVGTRRKDIDALLGKVVYLNGSMFEQHTIELQHPEIRIPNIAFEKLFSFFSDFTWQVVDISSGEDKEITPEILGHIFEMHFNQLSGIGPLYTPLEVTEYLCRQTIHQVILGKMKLQVSPAQRSHFNSIEGMLASLDAELCRMLLVEVLPSLSVLDPACGSGAFLVAAMNTLAMLYSEVVSKIASLHDQYLSHWLDNLHQSHPALMYYFKKNIITNNLFGVDIEAEAVEITRLRLFLGLIASARSVDELEPFPSIGFHISAGNSLVGLLRVNEAEEISLVRDAGKDNQAEVIAHLNSALLDQLNRRDHRYQQPRFNIEDIERLAPFHWGYEFPQIMNERGGFDVIITNPPWKVLKQGDKQSSETDYYQSLVLQRSPQYKHQNTIVNGRVRKIDINLYKLFVEQSYNLLCRRGYCGIVVPGGVCSDQSTRGLRELLFTCTQITGLFSFENRKKLFEELHPTFKLTLLTFEKGEKTRMFLAAFAKQDVEELDHFPTEGALHLSIDFIRRFSPGSLAIAEFRNQTDIRISEKMLSNPPLGERLEGTWNIAFSSGVSINSLEGLDTVEPGPEALPLYEGKMIHQYTHASAPPRYWINEQRNPLFSRQLSEQQQSGYHGYRLGFRDIVSSSDERTLIATVLPPKVLVSNTINYTPSPLDADLLLFLTAIFNSFIVDFFVRLRVSLHVTITSIHQLPVPRLTREDNGFLPIVKRAARLICTTQEFKELWEKVMSDPWSMEVSATTFVERHQLRAELDGLIAHLYNVTEEEFTYILRTFPLVADPIKIAAQNAYRDVERGLIV